MVASHKPKIRHPLWHRRGAIAVAFAVGSSAVLGAVALGTEAGLWYATRRNAQTAADLAAYAGVAQIAWRGQQNAGLAVTVGEANAALNGFVTDTQPTTVTVTPCIWATGPTCTANSTTPNAVQVDIAQTQRLGLAGIIINTPPVVRVRGIAAIRQAASPCMLSLTGQTTITGSNTLRAPDCSVASNRPGESIDCNQSATIEVLAFMAVGTASAPCDGRGGPVLERQIPMTDPYAHLKNVTMPAFRNQDCQNTSGGNSIRTSLGGGSSRWQPRPYNMGSSGPNSNASAICTDIRIQAGDELILTPGTYFFADADLRVTGGYVRCPNCTGGQGVTLVFTQLSQGGATNRYGNIHITGGDVQLNAPNIGPWYNETFQREDPANPGTIETTSIFDGILVYRDWRAQPNNIKNVDSMSNGHTASFTGNSDNIQLDGGFYLPSTQVFVAGTTATASNHDDCQSIVAATIQVTGNSEVALSGCANRGTAVSRSRVLRLVQ